MPSEPEKPIEEMLKTSARERREQFGADPVMPGPMRTLLHAEREAHFRRRAPVEKGPGRFFAWWPLLAAGTAVALLIAAPVAWEMRKKEERRMPSGELAQAPVERSVKIEAQMPVPSQPPKLLAMEEKSPAQPLGKGTLLTPVAPGSADDLDNPNRLAKARDLQQTDASTLAMPSDLAKGKELAKLKSVQAMESPAAAAGLPEAARPALGATVDQITGGSKLALANDRQPAAKDMATLSGAAFGTDGAVKEAQPAAGRMLAGSAVGSVQANTATQNGASPVSQAFRSIAAQQQKLNVLNRFVVEQTGSTIRFHDADGSTYTGEILEMNGKKGGIAGATGEGAAVEFMSRPQAAAAKGAGADLAERPAANRFYFRVTGHSKSINKEVVFEGTFLSAEPGAGVLQNAPSTLNTEVLSSRNAQNNLQSGQSPPNQHQTVRIAGRVTVEGGGQVEIEAVSVTNP